MSPASEPPRMSWSALLIDRWRDLATSLARHRLRTVLTAFGVFWGILMVVLLLGIGSGLEKGITNLYRDHVFTSVWVDGEQTTKPWRGLPPGREVELDIDDLAALAAQVPGFSDGAPYKLLSSGNPVTVGTRSAAYMVIGTHPGYHPNERSILVSGRLMNPRDVSERRRVAVIGTAVRDSLFGHQDPIGRWLQVGSVALQVIGVFDDEGGEDEVRRILVPFSTYRACFDQSPHVDYLLGISAPDSDPAELEHRIRAVIAARHDFDPADHAALGVWLSLTEQQKVATLTDGLRLFIAVVGLGTLFAGLVGVGNVMLISVRERTREIGIRKALGATPGAILRMVLAEALLVSLVSGGAGLLVGLLAIGFAHSRGIQTEYFRDPSVDPLAALAALAVLLVGALVAGWLPARHAARISPIEALRHE